MRALVPAVLLAIAAPALAAAPPAPDPAAAASAADRARDDATLRDARAAVLAGRPDEAIRLLDPLRARLEGAAAGHKERVYSGQTLPQILGNMLMAAKDKTTASDLGPDLGEANFWEAFALTDAGRAVEGGPYFERAVALSPSNPHYLCELAHWHAVRKESQIALDLYQRCLDTIPMGPENAQAHLKAVALRGRGYVLIDMGKLGDAEKAYRESLTIEPGQPNAIGDLRYIEQQRARPGRGAS